MLRKNKCSTATALVLNASFMLLPLAASAGPITSGFDLFQTPVNGAMIDLTAPGGLTVPVNFAGASFGLGTTDTIVKRNITGNIDPAIGGSEVIDIELVALSLKSTTSLNFGSGDFDLYVSLFQGGGDIEDLFTNQFGQNFTDAVLGLGLSSSVGKMEITRTSADGGTFDSCWGDTTAGGSCTTLGAAGSGIYAALIMTAVGDTNTILDSMAWDIDPSTSIIDPDSLWASDVPWADSSPAGYPDYPQFVAGDFYVKEIEHDGPHPKVVSAVPEPSTYFLFGAGLGLLAMRKRQKVKEEL